MNNKSWFYQTHTLVQKSFNNTSRLLAKAVDDFSNGSTAKNFIAPGGEFFFTPEARKMYLEMASGDAAQAHQLMQTALDQHNALYLKDRQPRGLEGRRLPVPEEKRNPKDPSMWASENRGVDPTALISEINRQKNWPLHQEENQDQANARMDKIRRDQLPKAMEQFTDSHEVTTDPKTLQNSFTNQDAFNNMPLHKLYNQLSKAEEPSDSQSEQWIAPGGEHLRSKKARQFFLNTAFGDAALASGIQKKAIKEHNDLYLADKQPKGLPGMFPVSKERESKLPPTPYPELTGPEKIAMDPAAAARNFNSKRNWSPHEGETQDQANAKMDAAFRQALEESLIAHTDPHAVSADPNNPRQWKYHGLQNSFANNDAYDDVPLHEIYNQLSKAYQTPAW